MPRILVLGSSSGFGAAACRRFAEAGYEVAGVHLDRRSTLPQAEAVVADVQAAGRECTFWNVNAADADARAQVVQEIGPVDVLLHSLAFGTLLPLADPDAKRRMRPRQLTMTLEVMAHSLVWWVQELVAADKLGRGGRIYALTSSGSRVVIPSYGAVSAAKASLETHIRQLAVELAPMGIAANAIEAGVTDTPALRKIPGSEQLIEEATRRNPQGRLTTPEDVADALVALAVPELAWMTGNTLRVDGGEGIVA